MNISQRNNIKKGCIVVTVYLVFIVMACLLQACSIESFDPERMFEIFAPPGPVFATNTPQTGSAGVPSLSPESAVQTPDSLYPEDLLTATGLPVAYVVGNWRCHEQPSAITDTVVFLHDGEMVYVVFDYDSEWAMVQAGRKQCYIKIEGLDDR
jgi:hypothetical protein